MKRILTLSLSIVMILCLIPSVYVTASDRQTISLTAPTRLEAEDYVIKCEVDGIEEDAPDRFVSNTGGGASSPAANPGYNGVLGDTNIGAMKKFKLEMDVYIQTAGVYSITPSIYKHNDNNASNGYALEVDGCAQFDGLKKNNLSWTQTTFNVYLSEGNHTVAVTGQTSQYKYVCFAVDYVDIEAKIRDAETISPYVETRIEAENYGLNKTVGETTTVMPGRVDTVENGPSYIGSLANPSIGQRVIVSLNIPIKITTEGIYYITPSVYCSGSPDTANYTVWIDGTEISTLGKNASAWTRTMVAGFFSKGKHTITIKGVGNGAGYTSFGVDYIEIKPYKADISDAKPTRVEAENYPHVTGVTNTDPAETNSLAGGVSTNAQHGDFSGDGYLSVMKQSNTYKTIEWELPVEILKAGVYKITARVIKSNTYWGTTKVYVDGTDFATGTSGGNPPEFENQTYTAILSEGKHTIKVKNTLNSMNAVVVVDYVEFEPVSTQDPAALVTVTPPESFVAGEKVSFTYTYSGTNTEGDSILRFLYKDNDSWVENSVQNVKSGTEVFVELPEKLVGKEVALEFVPVDSQGNLGTLQHFDLGLLKRDYNLTPYGSFDTEFDLMANIYGRAVKHSWVDDGNGGGYLSAINTYENWEFVTPIVIPVVPGETFDISFDAKVEDGKRNSIGFYSVYKNASGGASINFAGDKTVSDTWKTFTLTVINSSTASNGKDLNGDLWTAGVRLITDQHENYLYLDNIVVRPRMTVEYDWDNYFNERWGEMEPLDSDDGFIDEKAENGTAYKAFYVDGQNGSDSNNGLSENAPLKTIKKAKEIVQSYLPDMTGHIYVYIKGNHNLTETVTWGVDDSGQNGYNVIYTKWGDAQPEITMKEDFSGFTLHDAAKNIWKVYVGKGNSARQVYINGVRGVRARTDTTESQKDLLINNECLGDLYSKECGFLCGNMEFADFTNQEDIEVIFTEQWTSKRGKVEKIYKVNDNTVRIDLQPESWQHVAGSATKNLNINNPSWLENAYELLDVKGEWYINKKDGYLYYMPRDFETPETMVATIPVGEHAFVIAGNSVDEKVHNIVFDNLAIKYTTWLHPNLYGVNDSQNNFLELYEGDGRLTGGKEDGAVIIADAAFVDIRNCTFAHMGGGGIFYREVFQGCEVTGNHIYDMSGTAVNMGLSTWEARDTYKYIRTTKYKNYLINNKINNNLIHDVGVEYRSASAVSVSYVMNTEIKYNEIYNSSYSGIHLGGGMDGTSYGRITALQGIEVMYNYIHDIMNDLVYDGGCFYVYGHCGGECTVAYNYFENQRNWYAPLYFDTGTDMWQVHNNVVDLSETPTWAGGDKVGERSASGWMANGPFFTTIAEDLGKVYDNYSTTDNVTVNTPAKPEDRYESPVVFESGAWPDEAKAIINGAGLQSEYLAKYKDSVQRIRLLNEEKDYYFLDIGKTLSLDVTGYYRKLREADSLKISFYTSNKAVATVNESGVITATGNGKCSIYAEYLDGDVIRRQNITVVVGDEVKKIDVDTGLISLFTGKTVDLKITEETKYGQTVTITPTATFDKSGIASLSGGVLTANAEGNTVMHITYTSGTKTVTKDIPVYVVNGYNRGSTTTAYKNSATKIASGSDFLKAENWTGNVTASGTGLSIKGTTHDYMPAYYKNKLTSLISFKMTINDPMSWPSIFLKAKDITKGHQDGYMITFKQDTVELHKFKNGERTTIFGESMYNPIGGDAFTNSYKSFISTSKYYQYGSSVNVTVGTIDEAEGVRIVLLIKDKEVFDYLDRDSDLKGDGYFGIYEWNGNFTVSPYSTSWW